MPMDASQFLAKPIPLTPLSYSLSPDPLLPTFSSASLPKFDSPYEQPSPGNRPRQPLNWSKVLDVTCAIVPVLLNVAGLVVLAAAIVQQTIPYFSVVQVDGPGRLDYGILGASCLIAFLTPVVC